MGLKNYTNEYYTTENIKSAQTIIQCQSVIQITYDIVKAHCGELKAKPWLPVKKVEEHRNILTLQIIKRF